MKLISFLLLFPLLLTAQQQVPLLSYEVTTLGTPRIVVANNPDFYYVLYADEAARTLVQSEAEQAVLEEPLAALPEDRYTVRRYPRSAPADHDGDGIDDLTEAAAFPTLSPFNRVRALPYNDGVACIHDRATYVDLAFQEGEADENSRLAELEFVKFYVVDNDEPDSIQLFFMNTVVHESHAEFARAVGIATQANGNSFLEDMRGLLIYHPEVTTPSGEQGVYTFEFQQFDDYNFELIKRIHDLLAANLPFLTNNLSYLPLYQRAVARYNIEREQYDASRISVLLEGDLYEGIDYLPLHRAEGYGRLRLMTPNERPDLRDIVVYEVVPNDLPRVGGIVTTVVQTPLSHVNLRALQNDLPNAFIRNALEDETFTSLLNKYVYYRVGSSGYELREATPAEVDAHYEALRPDEAQNPARDLTVTDIRRLDQIGFAESVAFGAKTANLATMKGFGFPDYVVPDGFGIPFYFYDEFMKFNGFYDRVETLLNDEAFMTDFAVQDELLKDLRDDIEDAPLPDWMFAALTAVQERFPAGTNIRCRSSTNNEDLPGFSGAGLYDSKTHNTDEGHLSKTVKEVFASLWNFRAFVERDFYRIDHRAAAMGVLLHPNFKEEEANGVGITTDPVYGTEATYYLNTQVGEDLVTNPDDFSVPEEILLDETGEGPTAYEILRRSSLLPTNQQIMSVAYLDELRGYLRVIHTEFAELYNATNNEEFAMDIEYKIDSSGLLVIKQARPWIGFLEASVAVDEVTPSAIDLQVFPNPATTYLRLAATLNETAEVRVRMFDALGRPVLTRYFGAQPAGALQLRLGVDQLAQGTYFLRVYAGRVATTVRVTVY